MASPPALVAHPDLAPRAERIYVSHLCVSYHGAVALHEVSLRVNAGSICGLVGTNGAGKSTLFKALMGFVRPSQGEIRINGLPLRQALRRQAVAYVPQMESVDWNFPIHVANVVMMGRYGAMNLLRIPGRDDHLAVRESLERVELWPCATARSVNSPAASASGPSWRGPWPRAPRCCCSMSPSPASTSAPSG